MKLIVKNTSKTFNHFNFLFLLGCLSFMLIPLNNYGQNKKSKDSILEHKITAKDTLNNKIIVKPKDSIKINKAIVIDTTMSQVSYNKNKSTSILKDTTSSQHTDVSPLDIASNRGIFILSSDRMLQLRILGSVRANFNYTSKDMPEKRTFNPFEIPTGDQSNAPNFYTGINQSRLGFEVTRRTKDNHDIFIRIESDFQGPYGSFRVRHAYGQIGRFLIGQTWTLFNNVSYLPATVSKTVGRIGLRSPQFRYSKSINKKMRWSAAIEYSSPIINIPDAADGTLLQVIPDFTGRYSYNTDQYSYQVAAVISTISGRINDTSPINYAFGFGASFSGKMKVKSYGNLYLSLTTGKAVSHFMDLYNNQGEDLAYDPQTDKYTPLFSTSGYLAFEHNFPNNFSANLSFGMSSIKNKSFQSDDAYNYSYNALFNVFWLPIEGARAGIELANGQRFDLGGARGIASRVSLLIYYDF